MDLIDVPIRPMDADSPTARSCLAAYAAELAQRFPEGYEETDLVEPSELTPPRGVLLVAVHQQTGIACGGVRTIGPGIGEIRHMWVHQGFRRGGLGRRLLGDLERAARALGLGLLRLGTHRSLAEAIAMYRSLGYVETESYSGTAHTDHWFAKAL